QMKSLEDDIKVVKRNLRNLTEFTIDWYEHLRSKYSKGRERKTEIRIFDKVEASQVALANAKLYVNRAEGFIGTGMRKDEFVSECSDIDDIIVFRADGKYSVTKVQDKVFVGKDIIHIAVFKKGDDRTIYNAIYKDGTSGTSYVKRFAVTGVTRDKEYDISKGAKGSKVLYFTANPNGEAEIVNIQLKPHSKLRKLSFDIDFAEIAIKGRASQGNIVSKYPVKKVSFKNAGVSTLAGRKIWFDDVLRRLNADERGRYLGEFDGDDKILLVYADGSYEFSSFDLSNHFDSNVLRMEKFTPNHVYTAIHLDGKSGTYYVKRFKFDDQPIGKRVSFINETPGSRLIVVTNGTEPVVRVDLLKGKNQTPETLEQPLNEIIDVKGMRAQGNRLSFHTVKKVKLITEEVDLTRSPADNTEKEIIGEELKQESADNETTALKNEETTVTQDKPSDSVSFEITNPDDINLDDSGQTSLF